MAKLTRKKQKIFGSTGDTSQFGQIGSDAAGTPTTTKDIDTIQSLAQYLSGLYAITGDLNEPPRGQDINALYHLITRQLAYLFEAGIPEWEAATEYSSLTSLVLHGGNVWLSLSNTNIGNTPALGSEHWRKVIDQYGTSQESVSTSSRIFDLTGDRVPPIPDDPGGTVYKSKTIDRAGVPWTNFGALPVDGPFGKGLRFNGAQYLQAPGPMIGTTGTIALKFKRETIGSTQVLYGNYSDSPVTGFNVLLDENSLQVRVYSNGTVIFTHTIATISDTNDHDLIVEFTGSNIVSVLDGVKTQTAGTLETGSGGFTVGRNSIGPTNYFTGTIYAVRADSRVWTDEEIARWSRDPYSEESIPMSSTPTANAIMQWPSSGRGLEVTNSSTGDIVYVDNTGAGRGVYVNNTGAGRGVYVDNAITGLGVYVYNGGAGDGVHVANRGTGYGVRVDNTSAGYGVYVNNTGAGRGVYVDNRGGGYGVYVVANSGTGKTAKFAGRPIVLPVKTASLSGGMGETAEEGCFHLINYGDLYTICAYLNGAWRYVQLS